MLEKLTRNFIRKSFAIVSATLIATPSAFALDLVTLWEFSSARSKSESAPVSDIRYKLIPSDDAEYAAYINGTKTDYVLTGRSFKAFKPSANVFSGGVPIYRLSLRSFSAPTDPRGDVYLGVGEYCINLNQTDSPTNPTKVWRDPANPTLTDKCAAGTPPSWARPSFIAGTSCNAVTPYEVRRFDHQTPTSANDFPNHRFTLAKVDADKMAAFSTTDWAPTTGVVFCALDANVPTADADAANGAKSPIPGGTRPEYVGYQITNGQGGIQAGVTTLAPNAEATVRIRFRFPVTAVSFTTVTGQGSLLSQANNPAIGQLDPSPTNNPELTYHVDVPVKASASGSVQLWVSALGAANQLSLPALVSIGGTGQSGGGGSGSYSCNASIVATPVTIGTAIQVNLTGTNCAIPAGTSVTYTLSNGTQQTTTTQTVSGGTPQFLIVSGSLGVGTYALTGVTGTAAAPITVANLGLGAGFSITSGSTGGGGQGVCSIQSQSPNPVAAGQSVTMPVNCSNVTSNVYWWLEGATSASLVQNSSITLNSAQTGAAVNVWVGSSPPALGGLSGPPSGTSVYPVNVSGQQSSGTTCSVTVSPNAQNFTAGTGGSVAVAASPAGSSTAAACQSSAISYPYTVTRSGAFVASGNAPHGGSISIPTSYAAGSYTITFSAPSGVSLVGNVGSFSLTQAAVSCTTSNPAASVGSTVPVTVTCSNVAGAPTSFRPYYWGVNNLLQPGTQVTLSPTGASGTYSGTVQVSNVQQNQVIYIYPSETSPGMQILGAGYDRTIENITAATQCFASYPTGTTSVLPGATVNVNITCPASLAVTQVGYTLTGGTRNGLASGTLSPSAGANNITTASLPIVAQANRGTLTVALTTTPATTPAISGPGNLPIQSPCTVSPAAQNYTLGASPQPQFTVSCPDASSFTMTESGQVGTPVTLSATGTATVNVPRTSAGSFTFNFSASGGSPASAIAVSPASATITVTPSQPAGLDVTQPVPNDYVPAGCPAIPASARFIENATNVFRLSQFGTGTSISGDGKRISGFLLWERGPGIRADVRLNAGETMVVAFFPGNAPSRTVGLFDDASPPGDNGNKISIVSKCPGTMDPQYQVNTQAFCSVGAPGAALYSMNFAAPGSTIGCSFSQLASGQPAYVNIQAVNQTKTYDFMFAFQ